MFIPHLQTFIVIICVSLSQSERLYCVTRNLSLKVWLLRMCVGLSKIMPILQFADIRVLETLK